MSRPKFLFSYMIFLTAGLVIMTVPPVLALDNQPFIPNDVQPRCVVSSVNFSSWFKGGKPARNGEVLPADAVNFQDQGWCSFYQWSWQSFMWMTSPNKRAIKVVTVPFYQVTENPDGTRSLTHGGLTTSPRALKRRNPQIEETGQAGGGGVLLSSVSSLAKESSIVHYSIHVNDTFGAAVEGTTKGALNPPLTQFPITAEEEDVIAQYAASVNKPLSNPDALMLEVKTSWIDASTLTNPSRYVVVHAEIPVYDTSRQGVWIQTGTKQGKLALLGMHVVGSVAGHPELVWATFEHIDNSPNSDYIYLNNKDEAVSSTSFQDGRPLQDWLFFPTTKSKLTTTVNTETAYLKDDVIIASGNAPIGPSIVERTSPWGQSPDIVNAIHNLHNNTAIMALNQSLMSQFSVGDVRMNYALIGATWTQGIVPNRAGYALQGSANLANSTLETYHQVGGPQPLNCFSCHNVTPDTKSDFNYLSHIWQDLLDGFKVEK